MYFSLCIIMYLSLMFFYPLNYSMQFYSDTVKKMALQHLSAGSPLRTLCLLIANQPADVFSEYYTAFSNVPGAPNMPQQTAQV